HHDVTVLLTLAGNIADSVTIGATYQGCSEKGLCYAPIHKTLVVHPVAGGEGEIAPAGTESGAASILQSGKLWLIVASFFGFGLLLSLTPCVLPMIPIL